MCIRDSLRDEFGTTVIVVTHDLTAMPDECDRVALLNGGLLTAFGEPGDVFSSEAFLRAYGPVRVKKPC